ncbi:thioredoxin reductase (NADPH) [Aquabacterium commune]|uniref:Ferredoxin--NADP reductase n=1 Tax=Aquabacterium commune TaxID=70586 RepID=A0A4V3CW26_9BURK|nr:NAD(P)/FAD-dependent oxidoreductase [Aquabacterium commune]TDP84768.1 thioredoxin reductase (NADPH) [Aquabacterium commune]
MIHTDALVIGAGPVGLFQAFQLGLLGLSVEVVDALPFAGGQCMALYPDKPIYDVPGVPMCTGRELTQSLLKQAAPFLPATEGEGPHAHRHLHLGHLVQGMANAADGAWTVTTDRGLTFQAQSVLIAAGAGAFLPRGLGVAELDGAPNVHHHLPEDDSVAPPWAGQHLVVAGGGDEALSAVLTIAQTAQPAHRPSRLTLLHRRDVFQADAALETALRELIAQGSVQLEIGLPQSAERESATDGDAVRALNLLGADGQTRSLPLDHLLVRLGLSPKLGPLSTWGMALERKQISVSTASFATSLPRVHAVGDINTYPGKKRLLLCGFHEATLAAHALALALRPDAPSHLLYTTTSPVLHQRLGV